MAPSASPKLALQTAIVGNLRLLRNMAKKLDMRGVKDANGRSPLHFAAAKGWLEICKFLVDELGFDVNLASGNGETPVLSAAAGGNVDILRYLLDHGGDPAMPDDRGSTPLHDAAEHGHCEAVRLLLSKGVHVDPVNYRGAPLQLAAGHGQHQAMTILLEQGANQTKLPIMSLYRS